MEPALVAVILAFANLLGAIVWCWGFPFVRRLSHDVSVPMTIVLHDLDNAVVFSSELNEPLPTYLWWKAGPTPPTEMTELRTFKLALRNRSAHTAIYGEVLISAAAAYEDALEGRG